MTTEIKQQETTGLPPHHPEELVKVQAQAQAQADGDPGDEQPERPTLRNQAGDIIDGQTEVPDPTPIAPVLDDPANEHPTEVVPQTTTEARFGTLGDGGDFPGIRSDDPPNTVTPEPESSPFRAEFDAEGRLI